MTLDDLIFAIEHGAESAPMLKRFRERQREELVPMFGSLLDSNYGPTAAAIERLADALGMAKEAKAEEERIDRERSDRIKAAKPLDRIIIEEAQRPD